MPTNSVYSNVPIQDGGVEVWISWYF